MSEFDQSGFLAIDQFFGDNAKDEKKPEKVTLNHARGKRRGVGASVPPAQTPKDDLTKKILNVGRKRRRGVDDDDEEIVAENPDDDEEEAGRTAIASEASTKKVISADIAVTSSLGLKSKKKLGKKERQKQKDEEEKKTSAENGGEETETIPQDDKGEESKATGEVADGENQKKHKRRKVRSNQKNIRKDHREKKPDHLIAGKRNYQGRPLTAETRAKLNLPAPKERKPFLAGSLKEPELAVEAPGLAIDDLLEDTGEFVENVQPEKSKERTQKKRKK
mmetsp:Transcript_55016/g.159273  ORF Transcript_55016/g.159273 Transcript_55016/m.159273 type:complete len:278 (-) Transcript_55016:2-835(-)